MSTTVRLYLGNAAAPYTPATLRGAWDQTNGLVTKGLFSTKGSCGSSSTAQCVRSSATVDWDMLLYRGVSAAFPAFTVGGTVQLCVPVAEWAAADNLQWHVHIYVTQGDSDTPRGTILSDYRDSGQEWFGGYFTGTGRQLSSAQTLSSLAISAGDRVVIEIGATGPDAGVVSDDARLWFGGSALADAVDGVTSGDTQIGWIEFVFDTDFTTAIRTSQIPFESLGVDAGALRASQVAVETLLLIEASDIRASQVPFEAMSGQVGKIRSSQVALEFLSRDPTPPPPEEYITSSQVALEVLLRNPPQGLDCVTPSPNPNIDGPEDTDITTPGDNS